MLDNYAGVDYFNSLRDRRLLTKVCRLMMQRFLKQTMVEIEFLVQELQYLRPFFSTDTTS